eukprot:m.15211 g.15211  ORF g.15211 m.15211 type:complete len:762 (+) comp24717_c0_seq1:3-2288(+)
MLWLAVVLLALTSPYHARQVGGNKVKIFGVGLPATGTGALHRALTALGYKVLGNDKALNCFLHNTRSCDVKGRYQDLDGAVGVPTALYVTDLVQAFPKAKFVLTISEDPNAWFTELYRHYALFKKKFDGFTPFRVEQLLAETFALSANHSHTTAFDVTAERRQTFIDRYESFNYKVQLEIPEANLLVVRTTQPDFAQKLCEFLERSASECLLHQEEQEDLREILSLTNIQEHPRPIPATLPTRFAYATLLADPSNPSKRHYLIGAVVAAESIRNTGSQEDIVFLVMGHIDPCDVRLLEYERIHVVRVKPLADEPILASGFEGFSEELADIYRTKLRVLQLTAYQAVIFFDSDTMFIQNADIFFKTKLDLIASRGKFGPLNAGFFLVKPSIQSALDIYDVSSSRDFTGESGWLGFGEIEPWPAVDGFMRSNWTFYGRTVDQGLLFYYYFCHKHSAKTMSESEWSQYLDHFISERKPAKFITDPSKHTAVPSQRWIKPFSSVNSRLAHNNMSLINPCTSKFERQRNPCDSFPCPIDRSWCNKSGTGYLCHCTPPFIGPPSLDGFACRSYVRLLTATALMAWSDLGEAECEKSLQNSLQHCQVACVGNVTRCQTLGYNSETHQCLQCGSLPFRLSPSTTPLGFDIFISERADKYEIAFNVRAHVFTTAFYPEYRVFHWHHIESFRACRLLCSLAEDCLGYIYTTDSRDAQNLPLSHCIGLNDLGSPEGMALETLGRALKIPHFDADTVYAERRWLRQSEQVPAG